MSTKTELLNPSDMTEIQIEVHKQFILDFLGSKKGFETAEELASCLKAQEERFPGEKPLATYATLITLSCEEHRKIAESSFPNFGAFGCTPSKIALMMHVMTC